MYTIDLSETIIPFSLLHIINQFKRVKSGETVEIVGVDKDIIPDLTNVLPAFQFKLIETEAMNAERSNFRLRFKKTENLNPNTPKERCHVNKRSEQH
jgi:TusA-related sulfurtransferase